MKVSFRVLGYTLASIDVDVPEMPLPAPAGAAVVAAPAAAVARPSLVDRGVKWVSRQYFRRMVS